MARSTCEDWTRPEEQAAPALTAMPARSSAITWVSAPNPATAKQLVLGSRGRGGFASLLLGSTSLRLAGRSTVPVVIVRGDVTDRGEVVVGIAIIPIQADEGPPAAHRLPPGAGGRPEILAGKHGGEFA